MANDRLDYIDYAKGIGILIIIWGHLYESPAKEFTGSFKVPLFFVLSGVLIGLKMTTETILDMRTIVKKKWKSLMIPYLWFSFFDCIYEITKYHQLKTIIRVVYATITGRGLFTLWFLPALFFALIGFYFLYSKNSNKNSKVMISSATGCIAIACLITLLLSRMQEVLSGSAYNLLSYLVLTIFHALIGFIFVVVGFYLGRFIKYSDFRDRFCLGLIFMIFGMIINLCCKDVDLNQGMLGKQYFIFYIAAILLCVGGVLLISLVPHLRLLSPLGWCGKNSMALMVTHLPFGTDVAKGILENLVAVPEGFGYAFYCYSIIVLFFCITFEYLLVRVIAWRFNFLLGKY